MLRRRFKSLLCHMLILVLLVCDLIMGNSINAFALTPGTVTKELTLVPGQTLCLDTRYNYKIKKSNFIEYIEYYGNSNYLYKCNGYEIGEWNSDLISADTIDWNTITEYAIYSYNQPGYGFNYYSDSSSVIKATEDGEYLVFSFYSEYGAKVFIDYITNSPKYAVYDTYNGNNRVVLGMYHCTSDSLFYDFDETDDVDFRVVTDWKKGDVVKPNEVIIDYATQYVKVVANQIPSLDLTNTCTIKRGQAHYGVSGMGDTFYFQFDDTYPTYTYINSDYGDIIHANGYTEWKEYHIFGVDIPTDSVYYVDYFTGDLIHRDILVDGVTPTLYQHPTDDYAAWINSETGNAVTQSDLKGGLIVYGIPSELNVTIKDRIMSESEDTIYKVIDGCDLNSLSSIKYELVRTDLFNSNDYPFLHLSDSVKFDIYRNVILSASELKPLYSESVYAIAANCEAVLYDGETGSEIDTTNDIMWNLTTIAGKDLSQIGNSMSVNNTDIVYSLSMSDEDKESYPHIFSASEAYCDKGIFEKYDNQRFNYNQMISAYEYILILIDANATVNDPTCVDKGEVIYSIAYDFCDGYGVKYLLNDTFDFDESNDYVDMDIMSDSNITSSLVSKSEDNISVGLVLGHIDNFDAFANPYLLKTYGVKQYEGLHMYSDSNELLIEFYPTYENNKLYYNVCYNDDFSPEYSYGVPNWDYKLSFANDEEGIESYNEWLNTLLELEDGNHCILFDGYYDGTKIVISNKNNPLDTSTSGISKNAYNAVKFNLTGEDDESQSVTSVFFRTDGNDNIYLKNLNIAYDAPHSETHPIDELGHQWENGWVNIDINDVNSYAAITAINNSVVDLDSLLANAENEIDKTLLNDSNNKLRYRICSRNNDAYELSINHIHKYGNPTFDWADDYSSCVAIFECTSDDDIQRVNCSISNSFVKPTCTEKGKTTYTATAIFQGMTYADNKFVEVDELGHEFGKWHVTKYPTYHEEGEESRSCIRNDKTETRPIPKYTKVAIVDGYLRDDNGNPIKNSKVEMHSDPMYTYTDENGYFKFEDVEIGDHTLKVFDASNNVICEFALNIDIEESDVNDNYVSDKFKWDSTINESNVNLRIDGIKVNPPFTGSPETGVDSHIQLYFILFVLSFGSLVALVVTCRRKKESCE